MLGRADLAAGSAQIDELEERLATEQELVAMLGMRPEIDPAIVSPVLWRNSRAPPAPELLAIASAIGIISTALAGANKTTVPMPQSTPESSVPSAKVRPHACASPAIRVRSK